jgi:tetraacyldisaccharide 4'-kinase
VCPIDNLNGKKIMAFCGIASPDSFEKFLLKNGAKVVYKKRFVDHHRFSKNELENIFSVALSKGAEFAVTTEKDAVRIPKNFESCIPAYFLKIDIEIISGEKTFENTISKFDSHPQCASANT